MWLIKEYKKYGCFFSQCNSDSTLALRSPVSTGAKFASRPYLVQPHTCSSGFNSGAYPGKSSTNTPGLAAKNSFTNSDLLWIRCRSQMMVIRGNDVFSCRRNATTCSAQTLVLSGNSSKYNPGKYRLGLRVIQLMADMRSRRSQHSNSGVGPRGAKVRRTTGLSIKPDSSRNTRWASRALASARIRGTSCSNHCSMVSSSRSLARV